MKYVYLVRCVGSRRLPDLHISPGNLTSCLKLNSSRSGHSLIVHIHLTTPKQRIFDVYLSGGGLNCSPVWGILISTISNKKDSIWCKSFIGSHEGGLVTCPYRCNCPDICSKAVAYISNKMNVSLCKISGWNASNSGLSNIIRGYVSIFTKWLSLIFNSSPPSASYMRLWTGSTLVR